VTAPGSAPSVAGVYREAVYSPGKVEADAGIAEATARALGRRGARVRLLPAERAGEARRGSDLVFAMCQGPRALRALARVQASGVPLVHTPRAIRACHRRIMLPLLRRAGVPRPESIGVRSAMPAARALAWAAARVDGGVWVKRGDVHATEAGDVSRVHDLLALRQALAGLRARGVRHAVLEQHVAGRTFKFYGVLDTPFFRAFPEADDAPLEPASHGERLAAWRRIADAAARALGLAVYGGDLVVDPAGSAWLVDVNDWPSFGRCREDAAEAISQYLMARIRRVREGPASPGPRPTPRSSPGSDPPCEENR